MQTETVPDTTTQATLEDLRVAVARAAEEAHTPAKPLLALGAELVYYPCFEILPPDDMAELDREVGRLAEGEYDWLILTTASAVIILSERLEHLGLTPRDLDKVKIALIGANTRLAAQDLLHVDIDEHQESRTHTDLVHTLPLTPGDKALIPVPAGYRAGWITLLQERGAQVNALAAFQACIGQGGDELPEMLWSGAVDAIVFTSERNVDYFAKRLHYEGGTLDMLDDVCVACIGPRTARAAADRGLRVQVEPDDHTPEGLATALAAHFAELSR